MAEYDSRTIARFWSKVDKRGPDECWFWLASHKRGYGRFTPVRKKIVFAHRFSWIVANGDIPDGLLVLHRCDRPGCVNPSHLWLGTGADNMADMISKGRDSKGESRWNAVLNPEKVIQIRLSLLPTEAEARRHGINQATVSKIRRREAWAHVAGDQQAEAEAANIRRRQAQLLRTDPVFKKEFRANV